MTRLKQEPPQAVRSIEELFAIAAAMEDEAATRYAELARKLRSDDNPSLAAVFERLSRDERGHFDSVVAWSQKQSGMPPDRGCLRWTIPETFDDENVGVSDPRIVSAYRALAMAVRNEERAFAFWSYVSAHAEAADIVKAAEALAHEELEHVAILRRERRRAYREPPAPGATRVVSRDSAELEQMLQHLLEARSNDAPPAEAARLQKLVTVCKVNRCSAIRPPAGSAAAGQTEAILNDPVTLSELLVDLYLEAADGADTDREIFEIHGLASRAINRLALLRQDLPELG